MSAKNMGESKMDVDTENNSTNNIITSTDDLIDNDEIICDNNNSNNTAEDNEFDNIMGHVEDILVDDSFSSVQNKFCSENCDVFDDAEENKIVYTEIFNKYISLIEKTLESKLKQKIPGFDIKKFEQMIFKRKGEMNDEIVDLLLSFADFAEFKDLMLSHKRMKKAEPTKGGDLFDMGFGVVGKGLSVQGAAAGGGKGSKK